MDEKAWGNVIAIVIVIMFTAILIVIIWQLFATRRATAALIREDEYKKLAERGTAAQERIAQELGTTSAELADLRTRVVEVERMIKDVG